QWIDQYLRRELTEEQAIAFEARLREDPELLEEVMLRKDIVVGIRVAEHRLMRARLEQIRRSVEKGQNIPTPTASRQKHLLYLTAAVAGLSVLGLLLYYLLF
ncbi:MAG: hypothetical protein ACK5XP_08115, partial [Sphingobacteriia bacterium]